LGGFGDELNNIMFIHTSTMDGANSEVIEMLNNMRPIEEGELGEFVITMPGKLLGITRNFMELKYRVMINILGM